MKKLLIITTAAMLSFSVAANAPATPIEDPNKLDFPVDVANALAALVRLNGYRCDSISAARKFLSGRGFVLNCNNWSYKYEIEDKGGRWIVSVQ